MDERQREICDHLRQLSSSDAATWLMEQFPTGASNWGEALIAMPHRSWEKPEQIRLANYYLAKIPYASARGYEAFASFMSIARLISVLGQHVPLAADDKRLLAYHLTPVLRRKAISDSDQALVRSFLDELGTSPGGI